MTPSSSPRGPHENPITERDRILGAGLITGNFCGPERDAQIVPFLPQAYLGG